MDASAYMSITPGKHEDGEGAGSDEVDSDDSDLGDMSHDGDDVQ